MLLNGLADRLEACRLLEREGVAGAQRGIWPEHRRQEDPPARGLPVTDEAGLARHGPGESCAAAGCGEGALARAGERSSDSRSQRPRVAPAS